MLFHNPHDEVKYDGHTPLIEDNGHTTLASRAITFVKNALIACAIAFIYFTLSNSGSVTTPVETFDAVCTPQDLRTLSCSKQANATNSCCVENPGGLLLLTQIYRPDLGPKNSWTIHGLWGNYCNGSYPEHCDASREYEDVIGILKQLGQQQLLHYMSNMWLNYPPVTTVNGTAPELWSHEWAKHGTCMSTLRPQCFTEYERGQELVDYFKTTSRLHQSLPTFEFLKSCGIVPSDRTTYALVDVKDCLTKASSSSIPHLGCSEDGTMNEVWYPFHWIGRISDGLVLRSNSTYRSTCPDIGIKYPLKL